MRSRYKSKNYPKRKFKKKQIAPAIYFGWNCSTMKKKTNEWMNWRKKTVSPHTSSSLPFTSSFFFFIKKKIKIQMCRHWGWGQGTLDLYFLYYLSNISIYLSGVVSGLCFSYFFSMYDSFSYVLSSLSKQQTLYIKKKNHRKKSEQQKRTCPQ